MRGSPYLGSSHSLIVAAATVITLGCGDDGRTTAGASATMTTSGATVDTATGTSDGPASASEASVTQGSMSEGITTSTASDPTTAPVPTTTTEPTTDATTDATTDSTGAVSASSSTGQPGPVCGNGLVEAGEACDDGDDLDKNACSNACTKVPCDQQEGGEDVANLLSYIWISNSSQNTVSKINTPQAANCGVYGRIQAVG